jgi:hypothetical protein
MTHNYIVIETTKYKSTFVKGVAETLNDAEKLQKSFIAINEVLKAVDEQPDVSIYVRILDENGES